MKTYECRTQAELDAALKKAKPEDLVACIGSGTFTVTESSSVVARGSSRVVAWGSSSVVARESSSVEAWGSSSVRASKYVPVQRHSPLVKVDGGVLIDIPQPSTAEEWCDYYGVPIVGGIATLYKAVGADFSTNNARTRGIFYTPGAMPEAKDWDGGAAECGGGLHFSPTPGHTREFNDHPAHYVACPVKVADIAVHKDAQYPSKVKAPRVCAPVWECDRDGEPLANS